MIGMLAVGGLFLYFNYVNAEGGDPLNCLINPSAPECGGTGGACSGRGTTCSYNRCKSGDYKFCYFGRLATTCVTRIDNPSINSGCLGAKIAYCNEHKTDTATCGGTGPGPSPTPTCPGRNANCTWDCKNAYCWESGCNGKTAKYCTAQGQGTNRTTGCARARDGFIAYCNRIQTGPTPLPSSCSSIANSYIGNVAIVILNKMSGNTAQNTKGITGPKIVSNYPSAVKQCAIYNLCYAGKVRTSYAPFNKTFATLLLGIINGYNVAVNINGKNQLLYQQLSGTWQLTQWMGTGVPTFYVKTDDPASLHAIESPMGDLPASRAYSATLEGRRNSYDPYGDQRYSLAGPSTMKVKVSN